MMRVVFTILGLLCIIYLCSNTYESYHKLNMCDGESHFKCRSCKSVMPNEIEQEQPKIEQKSETETKPVSDWKCGSNYKFDYRAQKSDRTYGVPNGCQKIF